MVMRIITNTHETAVKIAEVLQILRRWEHTEENEKNIYKDFSYGSKYLCISF